MAVHEVEGALASTLVRGKGLGMTVWYGGRIAISRRAKALLKVL